MKQTKSSAGSLSSRKGTGAFFSSHRFSLNGNMLKLIACLTMLLDHMAKAFDFPDPWWSLCSGILGRMAFPLFCFLLTEGFFHTGSRTRYLRNMLILACLSEIPFDLVHYHCPIAPEAQNTCFTLSLGLVLFLLLEAVEQHFSGIKSDLSAKSHTFTNDGSGRELCKRLLQLFFTVLAMLIAWLLHFDYGAAGIAALAVLYFLRFTPMAAWSLLPACLMLNLDFGGQVSDPSTWFQNGFGEAAAFLALIPVFFYNGERGRKKMGPFSVKILFYLFYPLHLALLAAVCRLFFPVF